MLAEQQRVLREYLDRKRVADAQLKRQGDKRRLIEAISSNKPLPVELREDVKLRDKLDLENELTLDTTHVCNDDEYRTAGTYDPIVMVTTTTGPSAPCVRFAKELALVIPEARRVNRGQMSEIEMVDLARKEGVTDLILLGGADPQGRPTQLQVCHMPFGPCVYYTISNVVLRSDLTTKPPPMKQEMPHLVFHEFDGSQGPRISSNLKYLFPLCKKDSKRVVSFVNLGNDIIHFRHHALVNNSTLRKFHQGDPALDSMTLQHKEALMGNIQLEEQGPRFTLEPYKIERGTPDQKHNDIEWQKPHFIRKAAKVLGGAPPPTLTQLAAAADP